MKISIKMYGQEMSFNTKNEVNYNDSDEIDETTTTEAVEAFKNLLLCAGYSESNIYKAFWGIEN